MLHHPLYHPACLSLGCLITCIHPECTHFMCRWHCLEAGGCFVENHSKDGQSLSTQASYISSTTLQAPFTKITMQTSSALPLMMPPPPSQTAQDLHANLWYASQMPAVFTEQSAREQQLQESWCWCASFALCTSKQKNNKQCDKGLYMYGS